MSIINFFISTTLGRVIGILILAGGLIWYYGYVQDGNGYDRGQREATKEWSAKYKALENARIEADTSRSTDEIPVPPTRIIYRDRGTKVDSLALRAAFLRGLEAGNDSLFALYMKMAPLAELDTTVTQIVPPDSLVVKTRVKGTFEPVDRLWDVTLYPNPIITRTWLIKSGFIVETVEVNPWALQLTLGSAIKNPSARIGLMGWYSSYGIGVDIQSGFSPVPKVGFQVRF